MRKGVRATLSTAALAVVALVALLISGCGGDSSSTGGSSDESNAQPVRGGSVEISQNEEVTGLDPSEAIDTTSIIALSQIMEPLYKVAASGKLEPVLVVGKKVSKDERKWTFDLREGVKFSNGKPMTAEDAAFSIELAKNSAYYSSLFEAFKTIRAASPTELVIETTQPVPAMEALLSSWATAVIPKNYGGVEEKEFKEHPIGTGPFKLGHWNHGTGLTLVRNPGYWNKERPYLDKVILKTTPDPASRVTQLRGGQLQAIEKPPSAQVEELENVPGVNVGIYSEGYSQYIILNARAKIFQNAKIREAVTLGIDRQAIVDTAMSGFGTVGGSFLAPVIPYQDPEIKAPERDTEKAEQLVKEAEASGSTTKFTLIYPQTSTYAPLAAQILQQELDEVGLQVKVQPMDEASIFELQGEGDFDAALGALGPGVLDPSENISLYIALEGLWTGADTTQVAKLAEEGSTETDPAKRKQIYYEIQEIVDQQGYLVTLAYEPYIWGLSEELAGFGVNPIGLPWYSDIGLTKK
jgi:peptide/nickel transport system substrate-binding protein